MKFHGIDAQGNLYDQRVSVLPTWTLTDIGRIVFLTTNDTVYIASSTGWVPLANVDALTAGTGIAITKVSTPAQSITISLSDAFLASGRKLWIYENTAPTGWSIVSGCSDGLLAVKGGSSDYDVAGGTALQGTWTQLAHTHAISVAPEASHTHSLTGTHRHTIDGHAITIPEMPSHNHGYNSPYINSVNEPDGGTYTTYFTASTTGSTGGDQAHTHGGGYTGLADTGSSSAGTSHTHAASESPVAPSPYWRPLANVGIIVQKA
jgi:hypothetical protein